MRMKHRVSTPPVGYPSILLQHQNMTAENRQQAANRVWNQATSCAAGMTT